MKITVITVVLNAADTISDTLNSVSRQTIQPHQHLVIDGGSVDGTLDIIEAHEGHSITLISEKDDGLYYAMNKGISLATGEAIGFLNADDLFANESVLEQVALHLSRSEIDACYADLVYVHKSDTSRVVRNWISQPHFPKLSFRGWMPAHPTFYMKKRCYQQLDGFDTSLRYQADLEFCARAFEVLKINSVYVPQLWVRMRLGGVTNNSLLSMIKGNWESYLALLKLGMRRDPITYFVIKFGSRLKQYFQVKHH